MQIEFLRLAVLYFYYLVRRYVVAFGQWLTRGLFGDKKVGPFLLEMALRLNNSYSPAVRDYCQGCKDKCDKRKKSGQLEA